MHMQDFTGKPSRELWRQVRDQWAKFQYGVAWQCFFTSWNNYAVNGNYYWNIALKFRQNFQDCLVGKQFKDLPYLNMRCCTRFIKSDNYLLNLRRVMNMINLNRAILNTPFGGSLYLVLHNVRYLFSNSDHRFSICSFVLVLRYFLAIAYKPLK